MKVLLDECLDRRLKSHIQADEVKTVQECGWAGFSNGTLLRKAEASFDIFVTIDRNLRFQQNLSEFSIAIVLLMVGSDTLEDLIPAVSAANAKLSTLRKGELMIIDKRS